MADTHTYVATEGLGPGQNLRCRWCWIAKDDVDRGKATPWCHRGGSRFVAGLTAPMPAPSPAAKPGCDPCFLEGACGNDAAPCVETFAKAIKTLAEKTHLCPSLVPACGANVVEASDPDFKLLCKACVGELP